MNVEKFIQSLSSVEKEAILAALLKENNDRAMERAKKIVDEIPEDFKYLLAETMDTVDAIRAIKDNMNCGMVDAKNALEIIKRELGIV